MSILVYVLIGKKNYMKNSLVKELRDSQNLRLGRKIVFGFIGILLIGFGSFLLFKSFEIKQALSILFLILGLNIFSKGSGSFSRRWLEEYNYNMLSYMKRTNNTPIILETSDNLDLEKEVSNIIDLDTIKTND